MQTQAMPDDLLPAPAFPAPAPADHGTEEARTLPPDQAAKLHHLRRIVRDCGSLLVAYSGGVDSALVALVASRELGDRSLACLGVSPSLPARERRHAIELAERMGLRYREVSSNEQDDPRYVANGADRCFFCKSALFSRLISIARQEGWREVADGVHLGDAADHQHGIAAARHAGVRSPLLEAGLEKGHVRALARHLQLPSWDKPATPCLASRVPPGTRVTPALLAQIEAAEDVLFQLGYREFRVRHHGDVARIELTHADFTRAIDQRDPIVAGIRAAGYRFVTLDLAGFRAEPLAPSDQPLVTLGAFCKSPEV
jgi:uncharacterized protein